MFKALFGSAAVFVILVFAVVAPVDVLKAQEVLQTPVAADELSDEEIRQLLAEESIDRFTRWKRNRGGRRFHRKSKECSDYKGIQGPTKPVFCELIQRLLTSRRMPLPVLLQIFRRNSVSVKSWLANLT